MASFAANVGSDFQSIEIHADDGVDGVDEREGVGASRNRGARGHNDIGNVGSEFDDDGNFGDVHDPTGDLLAVFGDLANGAAHAAFAHAVGTAVIEFDAIGARVLNAANDVVPGFGFGFNHGGDDDGAIGPRAFYFRNFAEIDFDGTVRDQLDVIDGEHFLSAIMPGAIAIRNVEDRRANGFPDCAAPAGFKGAMDLRAGIGGRSGGQPKGIGRTDTRKIDAEVSHESPAFRE